MLLPFVTLLLDGNQLDSWNSSSKEYCRGHPQTHMSIFLKEKKKYFYYYYYYYYYYYLKNKESRINCFHYSLGNNLQEKKPINGSFILGWLVNNKK